MMEQPGKLRNFESLARRLRFRALGKACRDHGIDSLFLAHHEDDQAETLMMRLIGGHRALGLLGIKSSSEIPECEGIYGVCQSGGAGERWQSPGKGSTIPYLHRSLIFNNAKGDSLCVESHGIKIYRPLLGFSKIRLLATCRTVGMQWFEDHTNMDPKVTLRNATRTMFKNHDMPAALKAPELVHMSQRLNNKINNLGMIIDALIQRSITSFDISSIAEKYVAKEKKDRLFLHLETRAGTLKIIFPSFDKLEISSLPGSDRGVAAALLLRKIIMSVTPTSSVPLTGLHQAIECIFPKLQTGEEREVLRSSFTIGGVRFEHYVPQVSVSRSFSQGEPKENDSEKSFWLLSRQPYSKSDPLPTITIPGFEEPAFKPEWTHWKLYDGRFWFRIRNRSSTPIIIRPFSKDDMAKIRQTVRGAPKLSKLLSKIAPSDVRYTLPAIVTLGQDGEELVLALPTIGVTFPKIKKDFKSLDWEFRYKKTDMYIS